MNQANRYTSATLSERPTDVVTLRKQAKALSDCLLSIKSEDRGIVMTLAAENLESNLNYFTAICLHKAAKSYQAN